MKALLIVPQPFYSARGTPFSVYYRTLVMAEMGVEVDLLTYGQGQDVEIPGVRIIQIADVPSLELIKTGPSMLKLFLDVFILLRTIGLLIRNNYDFGHAHEEAVFFCRFLKPLFGFKLVYDMHSSLPQQLTNFNFTSSKFLIRMFEWLADGALAHAEVVLTICPNLAEYALSRAPIEDRHILIENSIFEPIKLRKTIEETVSADKPTELPADRRIVYYAGTFEIYQGVEIAVGAFAILRDDCPDAFLLMVGGNPDQVENYRNMAMEQKLDAHCLFTGTVSKMLALRYQSLASVLVSPRTVGMNTPLKIYELLANGIPLVATRVPAHAQVLGDDVCFLTEPEAAPIAAGILVALDDDGRKANVVRSAWELYDEIYSHPVYEEKIRCMLELLS